MQSQYCETLNSLLAQHGNKPAIKSLHGKLQVLLTAPQPNFAELLQLFHDAIPLLEAELWRHELSADAINRYQTIFREMEALIYTQGKDDRYKFIIIIPVADRPQHLNACLNSLLTLCKTFNYGGIVNGVYQKVSIIIADDSKRLENINKHKALACHFTECGIRTDYFGLEQQVSQLDILGNEDRQNLASIIGNRSKDNFSHKGPSIMRNITYLKLSELAREDENILFYFIDSDQEFCIKANTTHGDQDIYTTNYFYYLNKIFSSTETSILTGKVVGDPPVSPAVMTSRFLDDVISFLQQISSKPPHQPCEFHKRPQTDQEGAYHDMAELFGFSGQHQTHDYNCPLTGDHNHLNCLNQFANVLNHFFYGEHPTRTSYYHHENIIENIKAARTVYTGNYVFKAESLKYFIPFATLRLRMAGPVLGRIIKSELSNRFVSANLPMLHKRTVEDTGQSEYRPGIEQQSHLMDLSGEFERQFFGDIMLFTVEKLMDSGFSLHDTSGEQINNIITTVENTILQKYLNKHHEINLKLEQASSFFQQPNHWWNSTAETKTAMAKIQLFFDNIAHNFGQDSTAYKLLCSKDVRQKQLKHIVEAITHYQTDRASWEKILTTMQ